MIDENYDAIVIGAGQAGLSTSYFLKKLGLKHLVLERRSIGESWRSQRWDSFVVNTPNYLNGLPNSDPVGTIPDAFCSKDELVKSFENYSKKFNLPIILGARVICVDRPKNSDDFIVKVKQDSTEKEFRTKSVVIASGIMQTPKIPLISKKIPNSILQLHAGDYRNPSNLPKGSVVVVGGGQSGCQIVEDLQNAGRQVFLCTSKVGRIPRRYRGKEIDDWLIDSGFFDVTFEELEDKNMALATQPQVSGVGRYGHTVSLQKLHNEGVTLLGKLENIENGNLVLKNNLQEHISFADEISNGIKKMIDEYIVKNNITTENHEEDSADISWSPEKYPVSPEILSLQSHDVGTVIWCTGFTADFSWIKLPALNQSGFPIHKNGVSQIPGLYFVGFPWLSKRKSGLIYGVAEDAEYISSQVITRKK